MSAQICAVCGLAGHDEFSLDGVIEIAENADHCEHKQAREELAELRAKAARCDAYEREGEALMSHGEIGETAKSVGPPMVMANGRLHDLSSDMTRVRDLRVVHAGSIMQLARCRARVEAAILPWTNELSDRCDVDELLDAIRKALQ